MYHKYVEESLGNWLVHGKIYYKELPEDLKKWYCYVSDSGHCLLCVLKMHQAEAKQHGFTNYTIPVPVKAALNNYKIDYSLDNEGVVIVDLPYNDKVGLRIDNNLIEF